MTSGEVINATIIVAVWSGIIWCSGAWYGSQWQRKDDERKRKQS